MHAIDNGDRSFMQLIKIGAKDIKFLNIQDCEGKTALMLLLIMVKAKFLWN